MAYATQTQSLSGNVFAAVSAFFAELSEATERRRVYKKLMQSWHHYQRANYPILAYPKPTLAQSHTRRHINKGVFDRTSQRSNPFDWSKLLPVGPIKFSGESRKKAAILLP